MSITNIDLLPDDVTIGDGNHELHHDIIHQGLKSLKTIITEVDVSALKLSGNQTVSGTKTFSSSPIIPAPTQPSHPANLSYLNSVLASKETTIALGTTSQYFRGDKTWQTLNKAAVGLGNVDNTSDVAKPVSTAMQTALNGKEPSIPLGTTAQYYRGDKTWQALNKAAVGLGNVDNTSDLNKPISTLTQTALNGKEPNISTGTTAQYYRGDKTWQTLNKAAVGLSNVDNTSDVNKPVSTAMNSALTLKANDNSVVKLSGNQTIDGIKTFTSEPKLSSAATVGYVWTAIGTDGSGDWRIAGVPATSVDWANVQNKPSTFPPTIGSTSTTAAPGDHTHTKASIGLGNVDNTSDLSKPISTLTSAALATKVPNTRSINTSAPLTGGGDLSSDRTISITPGGITLNYVAEVIKKEAIPYVQTYGTRAIGLGENIDGVAIPYPMTLQSVRYRMGTADASGTTTVELRKNGVTVPGTSGTAALSPSTVTGSWSFSAGDILTVYITAVGSTPGKRLTADIVGIKA